MEDDRKERRLGRKQFLTGIAAAAAGLLTGNLLSRSPGLPPALQDAAAAAAGGAADTVNVRDYGAKGDGNTDDSAAFAAALSQIWTRYGTTVTGHRRPTARLYVPPGTYVIRSAQALMPSKLSASAAFIGLIIEGAGRFVTQILYQPKTKDGYLLYNNNTFLHLVFRDIGFVAQSKDAHFMYSLSTGNAQNYRFDNVAWTGTWGYGLVLAGTNTNSEMAWYHCAISGAWKAFLCTADTVRQSGDQFVNYNFYDTNFEASEGTFINMQYGGSINVWGGSILYFGDRAGTLFVLGNSQHNGGAMRFLCQGVRFELPNANAKLIDCHWAAGSVTFVSCDNASQQHLGKGATGGVNAVFRLGNESGPSVSWIGCVLQGKHEYRYGAHAYDHAARITYTNCEFSHYESPLDVVVRTPEDNAAASGGGPVVHFLQCRGKPGPGQALRPFDVSLGWASAYRSVAAKRYLRIGGVGGRLPGAGEREEAVLPPGTVITGFRVHQTAGAGGSYALRTDDGTIAATVSAGAETSVFFVCDTDAKRRISLVQAGGAIGHASGFALVEYLG